MLGRDVLILTSNSSVWRQVSSPLASAGNRVLRANDLRGAIDLIGASAVDLLMFDWSMKLDLDELLSASGERLPIIALVPEDGNQAILELVCNRGISHLCAVHADEQGTSRFEATELVATVEKILRKDCFGLDKYINGFGIHLAHHVVERAQQRDEIIDLIVDVVRSLGCGRGIVESVALVADELLTNAIYNAPRDKTGNPLYAHVSRREKITLAPSEYVRIEYGSDGRTFGLSVIDSFGALEEASIRRGVHRCMTSKDQIQQKDGGAGIGLYTVLNQASHVVVNVEPGVRTEVMALWPLGRKRRRSTAGTSSLHVFSGVTSKAGNAVPETIELSKSARGELEQQASQDQLGLSPPTEEHTEPRLITPPMTTPASWPRSMSIASEVLAATPISPSEENTLSSLRGLTLLRRTEGPSLDTTVARIRGAANIGSALEASLTYILNDWPAAIMLCREGRGFVPWTAGGDVAKWDTLLVDTVLPTTRPELFEHTGQRTTVSALGTLDDWLSPRLEKPGVSIGPLSLDPNARHLGHLVGGAKAEHGLVISLSIADVISVLVFACRGQKSAAVGLNLAAYETLTSELTERIERSASGKGSRRSSSDIESSQDIPTAPFQLI